MPKAVNGSQPTLIRTRWWKSKSAFQRSDQITLLFDETRSKNVWLAFDSRIDQARINHLRYWFTQGSVSIGNLSAIVGYNLAGKMESVERIAISPDFKKSAVKGKTLALTLNDALKKATFHEHDRILLHFGERGRACSLILDKQMSNSEIRGLIDWFKDGVTAEYIGEFAPNIHIMPGSLENLERIIISPRFRDSGTADNGQTMILRAQNVVPKIMKFEEEKRALSFSEKRTVFWGSGVKDAVVSAGGTVINMDYSHELLLFAAVNLFPLDLDKSGHLITIAEEVSRAHDGGFNLKALEIGKKNIGRYSAEFRIAQEMAVRHRMNPEKYSEFPDRNFEEMQLAILSKDATTGKDLWRALKGAGSDYLYEFERDLKENIRRKCGKTFIKLQKAAKKSKNIPPRLWENNDMAEEIAILSLAVLSGRFDKREALRYMKERDNPKIHDYIDSTRNYLQYEEERIFSLKEIVNILISEVS